MEVTKLKLSQIKENPKNVRVHGEKQINEFAKSINKFGIIRPIVVDENYTILCGHGLYKALCSLNKQDADVIIMKNLSEKDKSKLMLADNRIYGLGADDYDAIDEMLKTLDGDFDIPGYSSEDLELLYGSSSIDDKIETSFAIPKIEPKTVKISTETVTESSPVNSQSTEDTVVSNRRFIVCPNCHERIYLDD